MSKNYDEDIKKVKEGILDARYLVESLRDDVRDLPLKKKCPICERNILDNEWVISEHGAMRYYSDFFAQASYGKHWVYICEVCLNSLKNNPPLHKQVWEKLDKNEK